MKTSFFPRALVLPLIATGLIAGPGSGPAALGQDAPLKGGQKQLELSQPKPVALPQPPPQFQAPPPSQGAVPGTSPGSPFVYDQKPLRHPGPLVTPEQAEAVINQFRSAYPALGSPRLLIYVNRELIDESSGLKLIARHEKSVTQSNTAKGEQQNKVKGENRYNNQAKPVASLADKQTVRDVERLFGRPLRMAGAKLADQGVAAQLIPSKSFQSLTMEGAQATRDREAVAQIADAIIEILISSKEVSVPSFNGEHVYALPDIQATAIRLKDAQILGQASAADLLGSSPSPAAARTYGVQEITEATALALMEDMMTGLAPAP